MAQEPAIYECGGSFYRVVEDRAECLIGTDWQPSQFTPTGLMAAGARRLEGDELERVRARIDTVDAR